MKQGIHPEYMKTTVSCACGNSFETRSTQEEIHVEICSVCHPFYTGRQKLVDTAGRVERFKRKYGDATDRLDTSEEGESGESVEGAASEEAEDTDQPASGEPAAPEPVASQEEGSGGGGDSADESARKEAPEPVSSE